MKAMMMMTSNTTMRLFLTPTRQQWQTPLLTSRMRWQGSGRPRWTDCISWLALNHSCFPVISWLCNMQVARFDAAAASASASQEVSQKRHIHGIRPPNSVYASKRASATDTIDGLNTSTTEKHRYKCTCKTQFAGLRPVSNAPCNLGLWSSPTQSEAEHLFKHKNRYLDMGQKKRGQVIFNELVLSYRHTFDSETGKRINKVEGGWFDYSVNGKSVCQPVWLSAYPVSKTTLVEWQHLIRANVDEAGP